MARRCAVIGLDGATFELLDPLMQQGYMPTLHHLCTQGVRAPLRSTMPPYTAPAWTTFATGVNPGKHGCYDFLLPTNDLEQFDLCNSTHIRTKTIYEILHDQGKRSILINLPNSYPPKLTTPTITDMLTIGDNCVFPASLKDKYPSLKKYRLSPNEALNVKGKYAEYVDDIIALESDHMVAVKQLWQNEPWDLFYYLFSSTDWISHALYNKLLDGTFPKGYELFKYIDEQLAWFKNNLPADTDLYVLSDHGFKVYQHTFYFNKWLEQEGYLTTKSAPAESFHQNISKQDDQRSRIQTSKPYTFSISGGMMRQLSKIKLIERAARWFYHKIAKPFLPIKFNLDVTIDFEKTQVCFPKGRTMTAIYINDGRKYKQGKTMTDTEYLKLRTDIKEKLETLRGPDGNLVTPKVYTKEDIYGADTPERCPDLFYEFGDYWFVGQFHSSELFIDEVSSKHGQIGMFVAYGDAIAPHILPEQSIASIMPTLLYNMGVSLPNNLDADKLPIFKQTIPVTNSEKETLAGLIAGINI
ncbi:MAG: alkaline phosphatase family protein [Patescibacteria group bacterium]|jgi:predicted AlkP superfamily phosphohydrolase/phosphomutase